MHEEMYSSSVNALNHGGGNSNIFEISTPKIGEIETIQFWLAHIFQKGWKNHQLGIFGPCGVTSKINISFGKSVIRRLWNMSVHLHKMLLCQVQIVKKFLGPVCLYSFKHFWRLFSPRNLGKITILANILANFFIFTPKLGED